MRISDWSSDVCSSDLGRQPGLQDIALAAEYLFLLALRHDRPDARPRVEAGDPRAARAQPLRQRALRIEFQFQGAGQLLAFELLILPDLGGEHLAHLPALPQQAQAEIVQASIVRNDGKILAPASADPIDNGLGQ